MRQTPSVLHQGAQVPGIFVDLTKSAAANSLSHRNDVNFPNWKLAPYPLLPYSSLQNTLINPAGLYNATTDEGLFLS